MFKTITNKLRYARAVVTRAKGFAPKMAEAFVQKATKHLLEGEELHLGCITLLQEVIGRMIEFARGQLEKGEARHRQALRLEAQIRARRDRYAEDLHQVLKKARQTVEAFGRGMSERFLGLEPNFGKVDPQVLVRFGRETIEVLTDPDIAALEVEGTHADTLSPQKHVEEIQPLLAGLDQALDELEEQKRVSEEELKAKTQASDHFTEVFVYGSRFHEALYVLAGEKFHSVRLRPKVGRGGSPDVPEDGDIFDDLPGPAPDESSGEDSSPVANDPAPPVEASSGGDEDVVSLD